MSYLQVRIVQFCIRDIARTHLVFKTAEFFTQEGARGLHCARSNCQQTQLIRAIAELM